MSLMDQQWCPTSVQVTVLQARGLRIKGKNGTNDAYAVMQVGKEKFQTSVVEKSVTPVWKEEATFDLPQLLQGGGGKGHDRSTLHVHVLHRALVGPDKLLGQAVINLLQLSEDKDREKTEWFKLLDKTGKPDKERGEVLLDVQFMRNNMTASMFDLSAAGKSRSRLGKIKDKVRGKKKESDSASNVVPSLTQVLTDSEEEGDAEGTEGKDGKSKKHKMKSLFSPKSNLQKNMSQSMSVLPGKNSSLSGSQSSGLNVDSSEGKKKFKFSLHKRSGSSDSKNSSFGHQKQVEQSNMCINGSHVYCEEQQPRTSRAGSNFSLISSGHESMEDVPENSPPSVDSLKALREYSPWMEEEEEAENDQEDADESRKEEEGIRMEEERQKKEETLRKQQEELEKFEKEKLRREEEVRLKAQREEEKEEMRRQQEELQRLAEDKLREERRKAEEERAKMEEEERKRREEEEEMLRQQVELERLAKEEKLKREEEERRKVEEERIKVQREEEERLAKEKARQEEEERRKAEERKRLAEEMKKLEEKRQREEEDRINREKAQERKRQEEEKHRLAKKKRLEEEEKERAEEERRQKEELVRKQEQRQMEEEERARKEREEHEKFIEEKRRVEAEEKTRKDEEERVRMEEEQKQREQQEEERRKEEDMLRRREELEKLAQEKLRQEEENRREAEEEEARRQEEESVRKEEARRQEEEIVRKEEARRQEEERVRKEEARRQEDEGVRKEEARRQEEERVRKEEERRQEEERIRKEREENERLEEERRRLDEQEKRMEEMERIRKEEEEEEEKREREEKRARKEKEELDRIRNQEEKRRKEEERVRREEIKRKEAEETINEQKVAKKKLKIIPTEILSTNPFDEDFSPSESTSNSAHEPPICSTKSETVQRCHSAVPSATSVSADEKDLINSQREKRPAPKPPGRSQPEKPRRDLSALQQINKQSKEKDVRTVSVPPQRSVQMIAPLNSSTTKRPAPSRPLSVEEEPSANKTLTKPVNTVHSLNPFDDENELAAQENVTKSGGTSPFHWPPAEPETADKDDASQAKVKSLKVARAPAPPPPNDDSSSPLILPNNGVPLTGGPGLTTPNQACDPEPEVKRTILVQESPNKDTQPAKGQKMMEAGVKEEGPPVNSRRLQTVKPLNPLEQQPASVQEENNKSSGLDCSKVQHNTKVITGPYSQLTREELISLVLKQEKQLADKDKKISELELYIDNLLVRVIEVQPSILMSMSSIK